MEYFATLREEIKLMIQSKVWTSSFETRYLCPEGPFQFNMLNGCSWNKMSGVYRIEKNDERIVGCSTGLGDRLRTRFSDGNFSDHDKIFVYYLNNVEACHALEQDLITRFGPKWTEYLCLRPKPTTTLLCQLWTWGFEHYWFTRHPEDRRGSGLEHFSLDECFSLEKLKTMLQCRLLQSSIPKQRSYIDRKCLAARHYFSSKFS